MGSREKNLLNILGAFSMIILLLACSPKTRLTTLAFFFDGVPTPVDTSANTALPEPQQSTVGSDSVIVLNQPAGSVHQPYKEKNCMACHDKNNVGELLKEEPTLCYGCHTDFNATFSTLHGPVDAGFCSSCHTPHDSKNEKLLLEPGNDLCFPCHVASEVERPKEHLDIGNERCIHCHDPHGVDKESVTRKAIPVGR